MGRLRAPGVRGAKPPGEGEGRDDDRDDDHQHDRQRVEQDLFLAGSHRTGGGEDVGVAGGESHRGGERRHGANSAQVPRPRGPVWHAPFLTLAGVALPCG